MFDSQPYITDDYAPHISKSYHQKNSYLCHTSRWCGSDHTPWTLADVPWHVRIATVFHPRGAPAEVGEPVNPMPYLGGIIHLRIMLMITMVIFILYDSLYDSFKTGETYAILVGGLEHFVRFSIYIYTPYIYIYINLEYLIPTDELIFFRGLGIPPTIIHHSINGAPTRCCSKSTRMGLFDDVSP